MLPCLFYKKFYKAQIIPRQQETAFLAFSTRASTHRHLFYASCTFAPAVLLHRMTT
jgi:hypothetical protein